MPITETELDAKARLTEDIALATEASELRNKYNGHWGLHPEFLLEQWIQAVREFDTRLGYWEWVANAQRGNEVEPVI